MPYSCEQCTKAPAKLRKQLQRERGCTKPSKAAVWVSGKTEWYSCPIKFATKSLYDWRESFVFMERFGGSKIEELPAKWLDAWHCFEAAEAKLRPRPKQERNQGLSALEGALNRGKQQP